VVAGFSAAGTVQCRPISAQATGGGPTDAPDPDNIFLRILNGDAHADVVEDTDPELFTFDDIRPASAVHLLVIPRKFVRDASMLDGAADAQLVQRMEKKARELVRARVGDSFDEAELALGFHMPPWYSVPWLHLHAIYPRREMSRRWKYTPVSFKSPEWVVRRCLGEKQW
jgi:diadenosine tetraphosphate (Ap4A) HIT family hydrolase